MKNKIIISLLSLFLLGGAQLKAQLIQDPAVNSAIVTIAPTAVGETANSIFFNFFNAAPGGTLQVSPATTVDIQLSDIIVNGTFNPANVTGTIASSFSWAYNATTNVITGTLIAPVPALTGGNVQIAGLLVTDSSTISAPQAGFSVMVNGSPTNNAATNNDLTTTYTYTSGSPLPVNLTSFAVAERNCTAHLVWTTANEINFKSFVIERKAKGGDFVVLKEVAAKGGNSTQTQTYNYVDATVKSVPSSYEYRLKMVDIDGQFSYSRIQSFKMNCETNGVAVDVFPNPASESVFVVGADLPVNDGEPISIKVYNNLGQVIMKDKVMAEGKRLYYNVNVKSLAEGNYIIRLEGLESDYQKGMKFLKK